MSIKFHFLNVGDGDCTIVDFPERQWVSTGEKIDSRIMMIDIHHHDDHYEYENIIDYYKQNFGYRSIFRFICTHPHKDHLKGIRKLFEDSGISIINFWDLEHEFEPQKEGTEWEEYKEDWEIYCKLRKTKDEERLCVRRYWDHNKNIKYWDEDRIQILSPSIELYKLAHKKEDGTDRCPEEIEIHTMPYVLLIRINNLKVLLSSDANQRCWDFILNKYRNDISNIDILKAPHHGSESGFHKEVIKVMKPKHIVFSRSRESDNKYNAEYEYLRICPRAKIYKTFKEGSFILECTFSNPQRINFIKRNGTKNIFKI